MLTSRMHRQRQMRARATCMVEVVSTEGTERGVRGTKGGRGCDESRVRQRVASPSDTSEYRMYAGQAFLTGVLQTYARQHQLAIDTVGFSFEVTAWKDAASKPAKPDAGCYVSGLHLESARYGIHLGCHPCYCWGTDTCRLVLA